MTWKYVCYRPKKFSKSHLEIISYVEEILKEFTGYVLTVRQMYYQLVARDLIPNNQNSYNRIVDVINDGRLAGVIPWNAFEDRGRNLRGYRTYSGPSEAIKSRVQEYKMDLWSKQDYRPEVWVEKQALEGIISDICGKLRVDFFATKGYNSQSEQYAAGQRMSGYIQKGQTPVVFYLGDHDPSGVDMVRDVSDRLEMFVGSPVSVVPIALNMRQIETYKPPANYVKVKHTGEYADSRAKAYVIKYNTEKSWELDALSPKTIHEIIEDNVLRVRDDDLWEEALAEETCDIMRMEDLVREYF